MKKLLLAFLFLSIGAQAMEPVSITDVKGAKFELNSAQKTALAQCGTLANMLKCSREPISFENQDAPFITKENLDLLTRLVQNPKIIRQISDEKSIELFKLADYLQAPEQVFASLAQRAYKPVCAQANVNSDDADVQLLKDTIDYHRPYYEDIEEILARKPNCGHFRFEGETIDLSARVLQGCLRSSKVLDSLKKFEKLVTYYPQYRIKYLNFSGNQLQAIPHSTIAKMFPALLNIDLRNNRVRDINKVLVACKNCKIDLRGNPLDPIVVKHPERYHGVTVIVDKQTKLPQFKQKKVDKFLQWKRAAVVQGMVALDRFWPSFIVGTSPFTMAFLLKAFLFDSDDVSGFDGIDMTLLGLAGLAGAGLGITEAHMMIKHCRINTPCGINIVVKNKNDSIDQEFVYPSDYAYNLFGKN